MNQNPFPHGTMRTGIQKMSVEIVTYVVQVNGKLCAKLEVKSNTLIQDVRALALEQPLVTKAITGKEISKTVVVPGQLINFVAK